MSTLFFVYTVLLLLLCVFAASTSLSAFFVSHRKVFAAGVAFFAIYVCEQALIFLDEYTLTKPTIDLSILDLPMTHPWLKLVLSVMLVCAAWYFVLDLVEKYSKRNFFVPVVIVVVAQVAALLVPDDNLSQWLFYGARELFLIWCVAVIVFTYIRTDDATLKQYLHRFKLVFLVLSAAVICIFAEDTAHILLKYYFVFDMQFIYYLSERNIAENLFVALLAICALRASSSTLFIRFQEPPTAIDAKMQGRAEGRIAHYSAKHSLTARERDILELMIAGMDNQNIASTLQLSVGTVKAHAHSIYAKTGSTSRQQLMQSFWSD